MIKTVIFDLDDTLLWDEYSIATAFRKTCEYAKEVNDSLEVEALEQAVREEARALYASYETYEHTQMIGINPFEGLWGVFDDPGEMFQKMKEIMPTYQKDAWTKGLQRLGVNDAALGEKLALRFRSERLKSPYVYEDTYELLDALKGKYQLVMLTNGSPSLQNTKLDLTPELVPYFDHIVISGEFGRGKPDASIFEHVMELADTKAEEALMVGDNLMTDVLGSSRVGMPSAWINRHGKEMTAEVAPTYEIKNLMELLPLLQQLNNQ
ncbi:HAD-IA family hydrolase [Planococcaceae bacterium Storch 2/2-2]|nr:HAD-IA family hydrolase [Planococcaceae bacterium Storch 2/2-2]